MSAQRAEMMTRALDEESRVSAALAERFAARSRVPARA
jgi:hypothetical protein